jgi:hypothetical protein
MKLLAAGKPQLLGARAILPHQMWGPGCPTASVVEKVDGQPKILKPFLFFFFNVYGVHIRVSEQAPHCLFRSMRPLCALNDSLEKYCTLLSSYLTPFGALQVDIFGCVIHFRFPVTVRHSSAGPSSAAAGLPWGSWRSPRCRRFSRKRLGSIRRAHRQVSYTWPRCTRSSSSSLRISARAEAATRGRDKCTLDGTLCRHLAVSIAIQ